MNLEANKRRLWEMTNHMYKPWMKRERIIQLFEETVGEIDEALGEASVQDKNNHFFKEYSSRVAALVPETPEGRTSMFEERAKERSALFSKGVKKTYEKGVSFETPANRADDAELLAIRRALVDALTRLNVYMDLARS
jgi:hypothetical protein